MYNVLGKFSFKLEVIVIYSNGILLDCLFLLSVYALEAPLYTFFSKFLFFFGVNVIRFQSHLVLIF